VPCCPINVDAHAIADGLRRITRRASRYSIHLTGGDEQIIRYYLDAELSNGAYTDIAEQQLQIIEPLFSLTDKGAYLPRYHFVITWRNRVREYGNTEGTILQDEEEARRFAARVIRELKQAGEHDDPELCMMVKDAQGREVFTLSF